MKTSEFFRKVYGFRTLFGLVKLLDLYEARLESENSTKSEQEIRLCASLCSIFQCSPAVLYATIYNFKNTLRYAHWDVKEVYTKSNFDPGNPTLANTHAMPPDILQAYYNSMAELAKFTNFSLMNLTSYLADKVVLDYGSGVAHHVEEFTKRGVKRLILFDRPDVINTIVNKGLAKFPNVRLEESLSQLENSKEHIEVVWLSLVAHTKPNPKEFLLKEVLPFAGKYLIINSLSYRHGYSLLFDLQVLSHSGGYWNDGIELNRIMMDAGWIAGPCIYTSDFTEATVYTNPNPRV